MTIAQQLYLTGDDVKGLILVDSVNPNSKEFVQKNTNKNSEKLKKEEILENENVIYLLDKKTENLIKHNLKTSLKLMKKYKPTEYKQKGDVILLKAQDQTNMHSSKDYDWKKIIHNLFIEETPGDHATLFNPEFIKITSNRIFLCLQRILGKL